MMLTDLDIKGESKTPQGVNVHLIESDDILIYGMMFFL